MSSILQIQFVVECGCGHIFGYMTDDYVGVFERSISSCELCGSHGVESVYISDECNKCGKHIGDIVLAEW